MIQQCVCVACVFVSVLYAACILYVAMCVLLTHPHTVILVNIFYIPCHYCKGQ